MSSNILIILFALFIAACTQNERAESKVNYKCTVDTCKTSEVNNADSLIVIFEEKFNYDTLTALKDGDIVYKEVLYSDVRNGSCGWFFLHSKAKVSSLEFSINNSKKISVTDFQKFNFLYISHVNDNYKFELSNCKRRYR